MSSIAAINWANVGSCAKEIAIVYPNFVFGTGQDAFMNALSDTFHGVADKAGKRTCGKHFTGFWEQLKDAFKQTKAHNADLLSQNDNSFWKAQWKSLKTIPEVVMDGYKEGGKNLTGLSKVWGHTKGVGSGLMKRMPLIGSVITLATSLPNIIKATADEGIVQGVAETAKTGVRLGVGSAGAMVGMALCAPLGPFAIVGALVGGAIGDIVASKIVGKSYSERKDEEAEKLKETQSTMAQTPFNPSFNGNVQPPASTNSTGGVTSPINSMPKFGSSTLTAEQLNQMGRALASGYGIKENSLNYYG